jgi:hypothetical protein
MGIFKYIVQGIGWEIGAQAARRGIAHLEEQPEGEAAPRPLTKSELRAAEKQAARERKEHEKAVARQQAKIEAELRALKKKNER